MAESAERIICPACGSPLQPGEAECPICGTALEVSPAKKEPFLDHETILLDVEHSSSPDLQKSNLTEKKPAATVARKRHKKPKKKPIPSKQTTSGLGKLQEILAEAHRFEEANDLAAALSAYRRALALAKTNQKTDPSLELTVETLGLLVQRTGQLLEQSRITVDLPDTPMAKPDEVSQVTQPQEPSAEPENKSVNDEPGTLGTELPLLNASAEAEVSPQEAVKHLWILSAEPPVTAEPVRLKHKRGNRVFMIVGGVILLGLICQIVGQATSGGNLSNIFIPSTHTPTTTPILASIEVLTFTPAYMDTPPWAINIYDLFDSNQNSWPTRYDFPSSCGNENLNIQSGRLVWNLQGAANCFVYELPETGAFSDFSYFVDVQRLSGSANSDYGIVYRQKGALCYFFGILDNSQEYGFLVHQQDGWKNLINWKSSSLIRPGAVNRIGVVASGAEFQLFINATMVATYSDDTLSIGAVGIGAEPHLSGTQLQLAYDNFELNGNR